MGKKTVKFSALFLWSVLLSLLIGFGIYDYILPSRITLCEGEALPSYPCVSLCEEESVKTAICQVASVDAKLFGVVSLKKIEVKKYENMRLIPGGGTFGVRLLGEGVCVVGTGSVEAGGKSICPADAAGIKPKDLILSVNGKNIRAAKDVTAAMEESGGSAVSVVVKRRGETLSLLLTPVRADSDGKYKSGMFVRDSATGIGTVTFIDPETGAFGALGHGVCDGESGALLPLSRGITTGAVVTEVVKGEKGKPGELRGYLGTSKTGVLTNNTECGVFGVFSEFEKGAAIPVGLASSVKKGKATVRVMLNEGKAEDYEIEITEICNKSPNKCFTVRVTDSRLLEKTGGIVQGMSGSPIIQDGKLVGAVTHVMVGDPTAGYGIFIENMLNAAQMPLAKAS